MKKVKLQDFIDYLEKQVGQPYLWGGQHTWLTSQNYVAVIEKKETSAENAENAIRFCAKKFDEGAAELFAYDCSGLGMYYLQNVTHVFSHDLNANRMMLSCEPTNDVKCGYWVFRLNDGKATHIGYMVSDTEVIHAAGRSLGVIRVPFKKSYWHCYGVPSVIEFDEPKPEPSPEPGPEPEPSVLIRVKGSVRVREGNGVLTKKVRTVKNCYLPYLGQAMESPYWYMTRVDGRDGFITSNPKYTELREVYG